MFPSTINPSFRTPSKDSSVCLCALKHENLLFIAQLGAEQQDVEPGRRVKSIVAGLMTESIMKVIQIVAFGGRVKKDDGDGVSIAS
jgi:hypothetical protein